VRAAALQSVFRWAAVFSIYVSWMEDFAPFGANVLLAQAVRDTCLEQRPQSKYLHPALPIARLVHQRAIPLWIVALGSSLPTADRNEQEMSVWTRLGDGEQPARHALLLLWR